ncbi:MAG TPA: glycosyltransferase family 4 protein [Stellaceae bacterium]|nr:glycosyltransferase family 4 protein [Stellaceae bacterium]
MRILTFTTLYPNLLQPQHGIFVETRLRKLVASGGVGARVVAPCPWFPFASARFGRYAVFARIPSEETRHGLHVEHPRYPVFPRIGMSAAPLALCAAVLPLLRRQIRDGHDFDLIDAHYFYPDGIGAVLLGRALGRPAIVTARGSDLNVIAQHAVPIRWIRWASRHAEGLVAVSSGLKRRLVELGIGADRVRVLRNGVDLVLFHPRDREAARATLGLTRPSVLAVGNLVALKRHWLMLEAIRHLPQVELVIVGEGPERTRIENLARERKVADRVRLLGRVPQDRLPEIYSAADLLLLVSTHEGWPNVLLESMACGTAVVVSPMDGIADIVGTADAGRILADVSPNGLAVAIRELLAAPPSRAATRLYAEQFDWQSTTDGQLALFLEILERRSKARSAPLHTA